MMMNMRILILFLSMPFFACNNETVDCTKDIACTEIYMSLIVNVTNGQGVGVSLDTYYTQDVNSGEIFNFQNQDNHLDSISRANGSYVLFTDSGMEKINKLGNRFLFHGIINGNEIISQSYTIGHDCCHVILLDGNPDIVVN